MPNTLATTALSNESSNDQHTSTSNETETYFIGIEGGASKTTACLVSSSGQIIDRYAGPSSNPFTAKTDKKIQT